VRTFCGQGGREGSTDADVRIFFGAKTLGFFEIYDVSARTRGEEVEPVRTFCGQGVVGGQFLAILCGRLLWTVPKKNSCGLNIGS